MGNVETTNILLVEDDPRVRAVSARVLSRAGYSIVEAVDGVEALKVLDQHGGAIDLVLVDGFMPRMGGIELAQTLQARFPTLQIILTSGVATSSLGLNIAFLPKPYTPAQLLDVVETALLQRPP